MAILRKSELTSFRLPKPPANVNLGPDEQYGGEVVRIENQNGDQMVFTTKEVKTILKEEIRNELDEFANELTHGLEGELKQKIDARFKRFEDHLRGHITDKIIAATEEILFNLTTRQIKAEIERQVDERLKKIKDAL